MHRRSERSAPSDSVRILKGGSRALSFSGPGEARRVRCGVSDLARPPRVSPGTAARGLTVPGYSQVGARYNPADFGAGKSAGSPVVHGVAAHGLHVGWPLRVWLRAPLPERRQGCAFQLVGEVSRRGSLRSLGGFKTQAVARTLRGCTT